MGLDLRLMPTLGSSVCNGTFAAHTIIELNKCDDLWRVVLKVPSREIPQPLWCHFARRPDGEGEYGPVSNDEYGDTLRYVTASELAPLKDLDLIRDDWQNRAAWAYLSELPPDWPIILYWH